MSIQKTKRLEWVKCIQDYELSGLTQTEYCQKRQISMHTFSYHRARYLACQREAESVTSDKFIPLNLSSVELPPIVLTLPNGIKLSLSQHFNEKQLKKLLEVLRTC